MDDNKERRVSSITFHLPSGFEVLRLEGTMAYYHGREITDDAEFAKGLREFMAGWIQ